MPQPRRRTQKRADAPQTQIDTEDITQLEAGRTLLVQLLNEAHGAESAAVTTLGAHIAMTPEGAYRSILERHVDETKDQAERLRQRLSELGADRSLVAQGFGVAATVVGHAFALSKGPVDLIRGKAGEEKLFKNAKDELTTEAQEIATYDGIEAAAHAVGDAKTARLAVSIREEEQRTFDALREQIPLLATAMVRSIAAGDASYDIRTTGAAEGMRGIRDEVADEAGELRSDAAKLGTKAASKGRAAGRRFERATQGPATSDLPIKNYDKLTAGEVNSRLTGLTADDLRTIEAYERRNRRRSTILDRVDSLKQSA